MCVCVCLFVCLCTFVDLIYYEVWGYGKQCVEISCYYIQNMAIFEKKPSFLSRVSLKLLNHGLKCSEVSSLLFVLPSAKSKTAIASPICEEKF